MRPSPAVSLISPRRSCTRSRKREKYVRTSQSSRSRGSDSVSRVYPSMSRNRMVTSSSRFSRAGASGFASISRCTDGGTNFPRCALAFSSTATRPIASPSASLLSRAACASRTRSTAAATSDAISDSSRVRSAVNASAARLFSTYSSPIRRSRHSMGMHATDRRFRARTSGLVPNCSSATASASTTAVRRRATVCTIAAQRPVALASGVESRR